MTKTTANPVLHHITMKTTRLQEMLDWYDAVVGLKVNFRFEGGAWASNDAANHRIALLTAPDFKDDPEKITHSGMHHMAFEFGTLEELLEAWERLDDMGIRPHMALDHGLTTSIYYVDPDGNSVELQSDNFGDWDASTDFIRNSDAFKANPIGSGIDPAAILQALREGMDITEVQRRAYAGEFPPSFAMDARLPMPVL